MSGRDRSQHRVVFGILIILVGAVALLDNLHVFNARQVIHFWPMVFVVFGILKIYRGEGARDYIVGGALVTAGVALTLQNMGILVIRWRDWWPLFLIGGGIFIILTGMLGGKTGSNFGVIETHAGSDSVIDVGVLMSGINMANATQDFKGGKVSAIAGGVEIDLRNASMQDTAKLSIFAWMGGIVIKVPNDWSVVSNCTPILGGVEDKSVPPANSSKRLVITGYVIMGGVEVKN